MSKCALKWAPWVLAVQLAGAFVSAVCAGCTSPGFLGDRARDMADVFSFSVGRGLGVTARCGPIHLGLFAGSDAKGVRGGEWLSSRSGRCRTVDPFIVGFPWIEWRDGWCFYSDVFGRKSYRARARGKSYEADARLPLLAWPVHYRDGRRRAWSFFGQTELAAGLGVMGRLGFNPAELCDFVLGWGGVDFFHDDIGSIPALTPLEEERNNALAWLCDSTGQFDFNRLYYDPKAKKEAEQLFVTLSRSGLDSTSGRERPPSGERKAGTLDRARATVGLVLLRPEEYLDFWFDQMMDPREDTEYRSALSGQSFYIPPRLLKDHRDRLYECLNASLDDGSPADAVRTNTWLLIHDLLGETPQVTLSSRSSKERPGFRVSAIRSQLESDIIRRSRGPSSYTEIREEADREFERVVQVYGNEE